MVQAQVMQRNNKTGAATAATLVVPAAPTPPLSSASNLTATTSSWPLLVPNLSAPLRLQMTQQRKDICGSAGSFCHCAQIVIGSWSLALATVPTSSETTDAATTTTEPLGPHLYLQGHPSNIRLENDVVVLRDGQGSPIALARETFRQTFEAYQLYTVGHQPVVVGQAISNTPWDDPLSGRTHTLYTIGVISNPRNLLDPVRQLTIPAISATLTSRRTGGILQGNTEISWNDQVVGTCQMGGNKWKGPLVWIVDITSPSVDPLLVVLTIAAIDRLGDKGTRRK